MAQKLDRPGAEPLRPVLLIGYPLLPIMLDLHTEFSPKIVRLQDTHSHFVWTVKKKLDRVGDSQQVISNII